MKRVAEFVAECLDGDWDQLADIDPSGFYESEGPIAGNEMLKCPGRSFDCDDCELARAVYRELWGLEAPKFRGDTMNSFRMALGRERMVRDVMGNPRVFEGTESERWSMLPEQLRKRIGKFHSNYHTIGNFLPLPTAKVDGMSLNQYRGTCKWHDFFAPFLSAVKVYLDNEGEGDGVAALPSVFVRLMQANDFFWNVYKRDFERYAEDFFLQDYLNKDGFVIETPVLYHGDKSLSEGEYIYHATHYLDFAERVIEHRAAAMIAKLRRDVRHGISL